ncbi:hypothetical protein [Streptomyces sp. NPDC058653]|uniref:hypothetical protein n=1 Tax=Streptomyces sp. NPDC058653 TaxID=3346576 RepID=UPI0036544FA7
MNAGNGIDARALAGLVQGLWDIAPQLGLDPVNAEDFEAEVVALERDGGDPEQGGRIWRRIMRLAGGPRSPQPSPPPPTRNSSNSAPPSTAGLSEPPRGR